jgi:serine/threonine protein phosphatase 1
LIIKAIPRILSRAQRAWQKAAKHRKPRLPDGICIYAVSDIHGCANQLANVFAAIDDHLSRVRPKRAIQVFLGDYIDRGPASSQVIDMLIDRAQRHETIFLKGNHEAMLLELLRDPEIFPTFRQYGGLQTLRSYGLTPSVNPDHEEQQALIGELAKKIPDPHRRFFDDLQLKYLCGDFLFVHAGVRPGIPLPQQKEEDLLWIRDEFLSSNKNFGKFIVHGHTPVLKPDIRPNRINIDTGVYATGILTLLTVQEDHMVTT